MLSELESLVPQGHLEPTSSISDKRRYYHDITDDHIHKKGLFSDSPEYWSDYFVPNNAPGLTPTLHGNAAGSHQSDVYCPAPSNLTPVTSRDLLSQDSSFPPSQNPSPSNVPARSFSASPLLERLREASNYSPFIERSKISPAYSRIPVEDVVTLREFLKQVDLKKYGFKSHPRANADTYYHQRKMGYLNSEGADSQFKEGEFSHAPLRSRSANPHMAHIPESLHNRSSMETLSSATIYMSTPPEDPYYPRQQRQNGLHREASDELQKPLRAASGGKKNLALKNTSHSVLQSHTHTHTHGPGTSPTAVLKHHSPASTAYSAAPGAGAATKPLGPYRGKFGPNPVCASCRTTKTPYWRDAWHLGVLLCNACGLRFAKFKRRCTGCHYVPRKDDKGLRQCPLCKGSWTQ